MRIDDCKIEVNGISYIAHEIEITIPKRNTNSDEKHIVISQSSNTNGTCEVILHKKHVTDVVGCSFFFDLSKDQAEQVGFQHFGKFVAVVVNIEKIMQEGSLEDLLGAELPHFMKRPKQFPDLRFVQVSLKIDKIS